jgi:hypothetical protein
MTTYEELIAGYNLELNEANEIIMTREFNKEEDAYQLVESMNDISNRVISVCTYPEVEDEDEDSECCFVADFFFNIDNMTNDEIVEVIEIMNNQQIF